MTASLIGDVPLIKEPGERDHFLRAWGENKLVEFVPRFAIDLVDLIEQNRRHNSVMLRILRLRID